MTSRSSWASVLLLGLVGAWGCSSDSASGVDAGSSSSSSSSSSGSSSDASATSDGSSSADAGADVAPVPFAVTSKVLTEGGTFPKDQTCDGKDESPDLTWTEGPAGTKSYGIILNDTSIKFVHSSVYDIPKGSLGVPQAMDKKAEPSAPAGAKQTKNYKGTYGYTGPCPPSGEHVYEFVVYALDVETLPGVTTASTRQEVETAMKAHSVGTVRITSKYKR